MKTQEMKMKAKVLTALTVATLLVAACAKSGGRAQQAGAPAAAAPVAQGTASGGGGGYGNESGQRLLKMSQEELTRMLKQASPEIFTDFNKAVKEKIGKDGRAELIRLISNIKSMPNKDAIRDGLRLKFDYAEPESGESYIYATQLFFDSTAAIALDYTDYNAQRTMVQDIEVKMLHEAMHLLGYGRTKKTDPEAQELARRVNNALWGDELYCYGFLNIYDNSQPISQEQPVSGWEEGLWINIPSGHSLEGSPGMKPHQQLSDAMPPTPRPLEDLSGINNTDGVKVRYIRQSQKLITREKFQGLAERQSMGMRAATDAVRGGFPVDISKEDAIDYNDYNTVSRSNKEIILKYKGKYNGLVGDNTPEAELAQDHMEMNETDETLTVNLKENDKGFLTAVKNAKHTGGQLSREKQAGTYQCLHDFQVINVDNLSQQN